MKIENELVLALYGQAIEYDDEDIVTFEHAILGFEHLKKYILLTTDVDGNSFYFLQSLDDLEVSFTVVNPFFFMEHYEFDVTEENMKLLDIKNIEKLMVLCIVNIKEEMRDTTMNLKAPILFNVENKKAAQIVISENYDIGYEFLKNMRK